MAALRAIRKGKGLSQKALAQGAKTSPDMIGRIERRGYVPGIAIRWRIAEALGVEPEEVWPAYYAKWGDDDG